MFIFIKPVTNFDDLNLNLAKCFFVEIANIYKWFINERLLKLEFFDIYRVPKLRRHSVSILALPVPSL